MWCGGGQPCRPTCLLIELLEGSEKKNFFISSRSQTFLYRQVLRLLHHTDTYLQAVFFQIWQMGVQVFCFPFFVYKIVGNSTEQDQMKKIKF